MTGVLKRNFRILNLYINIAYFPFQMFFHLGEPFYLGDFGKGVTVYVIRCKM